MEQNENTAVSTENLEAEDLLHEDIVEEPQDDSISLEDEFTQEGTTPETDKPQSAGGQKEEPRYVRTRVNEAVAKATKNLQQELAALRAQIGPLQEYQLNAEAKALVQDGTVKDLETAKELIRYRQGLPATPKTGGEQPRGADGRFTRQEQQPTSDPGVMARIDMLQHQADRIRESNGPDVIAEFRNNPEVARAVQSGEMDFYDVAEQMRKNKRRSPAPMRSPNGASGAEKTAIDNMSDEQFERLEKRIREGARYTLR